MTSTITKNTANPPEGESQMNPNKKKGRKIAIGTAIAVGGTAVAVVVASALGGFAPHNSPDKDNHASSASSDPNKTPTPDTSQTPEATASQAESAFDFTLTPEGQAKFESLESMDPATFVNQSVYDRGFWLSVEMNGKVGTFAQGYQQAAGNKFPNDQLPATFSSKNAAQEASTWAAYAERFSLSLNGFDAQKAIAASVSEPNGKNYDKYQILEKALTALGGGGDEAWEQGATNVLPIPTIKGSTTRNDTSGKMFIDFQGTNPITYDSVSGTVVYIPFANGLTTGSQSGIWLEG